MSNYIRLEQIEEGLVLKAELERVRKEFEDMKNHGLGTEKQIHVDEFEITDETGSQRDFYLSFTPTKDEVTLNYNGIDYFEEESFSVDRQSNILHWEGDFGLKPALVSTLEILSGYALASSMSNTNLRAVYLTNEKYDESVYPELVDPECVKRYKDNHEIVIAPKLNTKKITDMQYMFYGCERLTDVPKYTTSNVVNMAYMFSRCALLKKIPQFDTFNVTSMLLMFYECRSLETIPLLDTSNVTNMWKMFMNCSSLKTVPQFDTSNVNDMYCMFGVCTSLKTVPRFDTSKVTNMGSMFSGCILLEKVPRFDTSKVTNMGGMFSECTLLETVPRFDTSKVTDMGGMFSGCILLETVPRFDTSKVTNMSGMFDGCTSLKTIPQLDTSNVSKMYSMFDGCTSLKNLSFIPNSIKCDIAFRSVPLLTKESLLSIINGLNNSVTGKTLTLHADSKALLSADELKIATDKGWAVV